jgi:hypothetical protein
LNYNKNTSLNPLTDGINSGIIFLKRVMGSIEEIIEQMMRNPRDVGFADLCKVCEHYFGEARKKGSHVIHKTPWQGDPRINIQNDKGKAKAYQVRQVLNAIERLGVENGAGK